ncbi:3-hydroxyacyl-CoA dehydrogenase NAD-binding domain-containing protein [Halobacteriovorax sp. GB3]|uniref:3-hydroxyacyl-CoA dehydrogenase NAD-binding domain-containing protein n=1 Tax=Halobacteriovorax sp. GB3 TaxID=2719615 RepID=UPI00235F8F56|nr:3-hydroxyacyl-CoA dehydrogenase NAD-binding domain-containing protein [Halobacteriovorax sp. GB3]MDD0852734.1 3-hydroxyacyl-CoA dehydrogenase NAD-binding domain-containing protein [Halobacteriovorax sp. GB3]
MSYKRISFEIEDRKALIGFGYNCDKSMTTLDEESMGELRDIIEELHAKKKDLDGAIFFSHKDRCFLAGADINLIAGMKTESDGAYGAEQGQNIYNRLEDLSIPTVACVNGICLGGGTEFILACNSVIASDAKGTMMGLPEVKLGLIPGFGGTYRMPKKIGLPKALDLILSGRTVNGKKAKRLGLVDEVYPKERLVEQASKHFVKKAKKGGLKESLESMASDNFLSKKIIFQKARENVLKKTKGFYQAPLKILDVMEAGMMKGRSSYLASEAQAFGELCVGEQSKNLQHIFFMTEKVKKYSGPESSADVPKLSRGGVLGAGTMGGGIAWLMAQSNMAPIMKDLNVDALELGLKQSSSNFMGAVKRKKMSFDDFERKQRSICPQTDYRGFNKIDLLIEAIVENMDIKKKVFAETEKYMRDDALLTSNTSSLSVQEMASALEKPERFAGLHFFNPVHRMPLVEIITHDKVAPETLESLYNWVLKSKKTPVIVKDGPGFLVNRILMPYMNEAGFLLEEGVSIKDIEDACLNFGMPMGPCRLLDEVGIDVGEKVAKIIYDGLGERAKSSGVSKTLVEKGLLGRKTNKGFYNYDEKGKEDGFNDEAMALLPKASKKMSETEIQMRIFLPMINEASTVLEDGIVQSADDVDLGLIFGIGFPPFRGGLLRYADSEGLDRIVEALAKYAESVDKDRYGASDLLKKLAAEKKKFYEMN